MGTNVLQTSIELIVASTALNVPYADVRGSHSSITATAITGWISARTKPPWSYGDVCRGPRIQDDSAGRDFACNPQVVIDICGDRVQNAESNHCRVATETR